jgi:peptidoglycan-N-acetylglucosamine deacetylase
VRLKILPLASLNKLVNDFGWGIRLSDNVGIDSSKEFFVGNKRAPDEPNQLGHETSGDPDFYFFRRSKSKNVIFLSATISAFVTTLCLVMGYLVFFKQPQPQNNPVAESGTPPQPSTLPTTSPTPPVPPQGPVRFWTSTAPSPVQPNAPTSGQTQPTPQAGIPYGLPQPPLNQPRVDITFTNRQSLLAQMSPNTIALTFDDGPDPIYTLQILEKLRQYQAKATFFLIGSRVRQHCAIVRQLVMEGHELGNHTFTHPRLTELSADAQAKEIWDTQVVVNQCVGSAYLPRWFRSPYSRQNSSTFAVLNQLGLSSALWSIDTRDWHQDFDSQTIASSILQAQGQDIVIMHDGLEANPKYHHAKSATTRTATVASLDLFLQKMQLQGFQFVTLSQAFQQKARASSVSLSPQ